MKKYKGFEIVGVVSTTNNDADCVFVVKNAMLGEIEDFNQPLTAREIIKKFASWGTWKGKQVDEINKHVTYFWHPSKTIYFYITLY